MKKIFYRLVMAASIAAGIAGFGCKDAPKKEADTAPAANPAPAPARNFERAVIPSMLTDSGKQADFLIAHFWDKFNFRDTLFAHLPDVTEQAFVDFIDLFPRASSPEHVVEGVNRLLNAAAAEPVMYTYFCSLAERYLYDPNSPMRNDEFFIPFLEHLIAAPHIADVRKIRPQRLLTLTRRNRVGDIAGDFLLATVAGKSVRLHDIAAEYLLLIFYNPGCAECLHTIGLLRKSAAVAGAEAAGRLVTAAVYPDENLDEWHKHRNDLPPSWINARDVRLAIKNHEIYDLKAIPMIFLLDKDKRVILKDASADDVSLFFDKIGTAR